MCASQYIQFCSAAYNYVPLVQFLNISLIFSFCIRLFCISCFSLLFYGLYFTIQSLLVWTDITPAEQSIAQNCNSANKMIIIWGDGFSLQRESMCNLFASTECTQQAGKGSISFWKWITDTIQWMCLMKNQGSTTLNTSFIRRKSNNHLHKFLHPLSSYERCHIL